MILLCCIIVFIAGLTIGYLIGVESEKTRDPSIESYGCVHQWDKWRVVDGMQIRTCKKCGLKTVLRSSETKQKI